MWFKGNIHTHTNKSDGDSDPEPVVRWYRRNGYDFLVLTDHNHLTLLDYGSKKRRFRRPLMIPGEELSVQISNGKTAIHLNGIGITRMVEPIDAGDVVSTLQANIDAVRRAGGIASINHPNYTWAFDDRHIVQVAGASLLEIFNGNSVTNVYGGGGHPSYEEIWDRVLSAGRPIFGVAVDDSHHFKGDFKPSLANPGRGWVVVEAPALEPAAIIDALEKGDFYSSTEVILEELKVEPGSIELRIRQEWDFIYETSFIGHGGRVLSQEYGTEARYIIRGDEGYVRAQVKSSQGGKAWTQPVFTGP
ncbi:MAG: PHP domain-containing protein [Chloroflexi bacterium]|nr:PHP domain-containing protein [Chloroflexota bacterium]